MTPKINTQISNHAFLASIEKSVRDAKKDELVLKSDIMLYKNYWATGNKVTVFWAPKSAHLKYKCST
jgi:hypothetical protein